MGLGRNSLGFMSKVQPVWYFQILGGWGDPKQQVIYICLFLAIPTELKNVYIHDYCVPNVTSLPPPNSFVEILIPDVRALGAGAFGRCSKHEGGALVHGIGVLPISVQRAPKPLCPMGIL